MINNDMPLNILVVDDVPQNLLAMQGLLADEGVNVLTAGSGPDALELLLHTEVALALLDVQMPGMDGYALAELMRGAERTRHVPIMFLTAGDQSDHRGFRGYEAGAVDFLVKPVDTRVLRSKVQVFVDLHRQSRLLADRMAQLERMTRLNALMVGALSHDIRTPLAALTLNAELVIRKGQAPGVVQAGERIKSATAMLGRQLDHLVNVAQVPGDAVHPQMAALDLADLVSQRVALASTQMLDTPPSVQVDGDSHVDGDAAMLAQALDHLLLLAAVHGKGAPVRVALDGYSRRSLMLRLAFDTVLPDAVRVHLFGGGSVSQGEEPSSAGAGLLGLEHIARAHGGSLIGRSREREGTLFELLLPRNAGSD